MEARLDYTGNAMAMKLIKYINSAGDYQPGQFG